MWKRAYCCLYGPWPGFLPGMPHPPRSSSTSWSPQENKASAVLLLGDHSHSTPRAQTFAKSTAGGFQKRGSLPGVDVVQRRWVVKQLSDLPSELPRSQASQIISRWKCQDTLALLLSDAPLPWRELWCWYTHGWGCRCCTGLVPILLCCSDS